MKKLILIILLSLISFTSCVNESDDYNLNHDQLYEVSAPYLLTNAQKELADQMTTPSVNLNIFRFFSQYWAATQYTTESRYRIKTRKIADNHWNNLYRDCIGNLESAKKAVNKEIRPITISQEDWDAQQANKIAIIEVQEVYTYQILVDTFGDVPYSEALKPEIVNPKYDSAAAIYPQLINRLDEAIQNLNDDFGSFESGDFIYNGDVSKWKLFANSLKVKLGIAISDVDNALAKSTIESAVSNGVITSNLDNAQFAYTSTAPNYNPIYANLVASGRNDYVPAKTIINDMNSLNDPRRQKYFTQYNGSYVGGNYGFSNNYAVLSHVSDNIKDPGAPGLLFEATEVYFYLAEAAERGYSVGDTAENFYNLAIQTSFESWGLSATDAANYLASTDVAYTTATGTWKQKIGRQAWLAYYNRGMESWNTWRRLDAPTLVAPTNALPEANGQVPKRYTYPINEQTVNGENYNAASSTIGGDYLYTKLFWDVN